MNSGWVSDVAFEIVGDTMKKLLVIGREGRLIKYAPEPDKLKEYDIVYAPVGARDEELLTKGKDADFILVDAIGSISGNVIRQMANLKLIHSEGVGYQGVDLDAAKECGVYVCNCKGMNASAVAEQAVLLMLGVLRDVCGGDRSVRAGRQIETKEQYMIEGNLTELSECTVGLIGFGDIAKATARLLRAFGAKVVYTKKSPAPPDVETRYGVSFLPQDDLLAVSDIVSLHAPVNDETRYMVDASFLEKMKDTAYLINTSRGELVDSKALIAALESGSIAGAGLDTIDGEPIKSDNPLLQTSEEAGRKLLLSCHIGGITRASFSRGYAMILEAIEKVSRGEIPDNIVG